MTPEIFHNQAMALAQQKRLAEAVAAFDQALRLNPAYGEAHHGRGVVMHMLGRTEDAIASYERALRVRPDNADTLYNRGNALLQSRRMEEAVDSFDRALRFAPGNAQALLNRGYALMHLDKPDQALGSFEKALRLRPGLVDAHYNRGMALAALDRPQEAVTSYDTASQLAPDHAGAWHERGVALMTLKRPEEALASFDKALQLRPDFAEAFYNRGVALAALKQVEQAVASLTRASHLKPGNLAALSLRAFIQATVCDWRSRAQDALLLQRGLHLEGAEPWAAFALDADPANLLARARKWTATHHTAAPALALGAAARPAKLRIGYFSANLHDHPVMHNMARVFEKHDKSRFEIHLFSFGADIQDEMRRRAVDAADRFHDVRAMNDAGIAALAREMGIDIAIDLMGYTKDSRPDIFARRAAPIQVNYLGFAGTMGTDFMDYILADRWVVPEADQRFFAEKVFYLPHSYFTTDDRRAASDRVFTRRELGLPEDGVVFCSFNNSYKFSPAEFDVWMRLLSRIEGSVLWLRLDDERAKANLGREAEARGIDRSRLVFAGRLPLGEHFARHRCADLFLDTFNYNAHCTAFDALWAGLPLVTLSGRSWPSRVAGSQLHAIGLSELVTQSTEAYEQLAFDLATDPARLAAVKAKLEANRWTTPLFDTDGMTRAFETAYDEMYERRLRGPA